MTAKSAAKNSSPVTNDGSTRAKQRVSGWSLGRILLVACVLGVALTASSLVVKHGVTQMYCAPTNPGPLDELGVAIRYERGFPLAYYTDPMPKGCFGELQTMSVTERPDYSTKWSHAFADFLIYSGVSFVVGWLILKRRHSI